MKKLLKIFIILVILGTIAYGVKTIFFSASAENAVGPLVSTKVTQTTISTTISATGTLEPVDQVEVGTQVSGDIAKINVDFNSKVKNKFSVSSGYKPKRSFSSARIALISSIVRISPIRRYKSMRTSSSGI